MAFNYESVWKASYSSEQLTILVNNRAKLVHVFRVSIDEGIVRRVFQKTRQVCMSVLRKGSGLPSRVRNSPAVTIIRTNSLFPWKSIALKPVSSELPSGVPWLRLLGY